MNRMVHKYSLSLAMDSESSSVYAQQHDLDDHDPNVYVCCLWSWSIRWDARGAVLPGCTTPPTAAGSGARGRYEGATKVIAYMHVNGICKRGLLRPCGFESCLCRWWLVWQTVVPCPVVVVLHALDR